MYSEMIKEVKYGHNKDLDDLGQINLALVLGEESMLPVCYRKLTGNIHDVSTVKKILTVMEYHPLRLVRDMKKDTSKIYINIYWGKTDYKFITRKSFKP